MAEDFRVLFIDVCAALVCGSLLVWVVSVSLPSECAMGGLVQQDALVSSPDGAFPPTPVTCCRLSQQLSKREKDTREGEGVASIIQKCHKLRLWGGGWWWGRRGCQRRVSQKTEGELGFPEFSEHSGDSAFLCCFLAADLTGPCMRP